MDSHESTATEVKTMPGGRSNALRLRDSVGHLGVHCIKCVSGSSTDAAE